VDRQAPNKISTIWHLVAINPESFYGWSDFYNLRKRFDIFVGLSEKELVIESGFDRLHSSAFKFRHFNLLQNTAVVSRNNREMEERLGRLSQIRERWEQALILDHTARVVPSVKSDKVPNLRSLILKHSLTYLLFQLGIAVLGGVLAYLDMQARSDLSPMLLLSIAIGGVLLYKLPKTLSVIKIVFRHLPVDGSLKQIGYALMESLCKTGFIETSHRIMKVNVSKGFEGEFYVSLKGSTFYESSLFADCLAEILAPIDNPRYIVLREGTFMGMHRDDYHAVPMKLAAKKENALVFYKSWCKHVSLSELIYTRTADGRKRLLKAKMQAFSSTFKNEVKRQDRWQ